jgi:hypothetical protein
MRFSGGIAHFDAAPTANFARSKKRTGTGQVQ